MQHMLGRINTGNQLPWLSDVRRVQKLQHCYFYVCLRLWCLKNMFDWDLETKQELYWLHLRPIVEDKMTICRGHSYKMQLRRISAIIKRKMFSETNNTVVSHCE